MAPLGFQQQGDPYPGGEDPGSRVGTDTMNERKPLGQQTQMETATTNRSKKGTAKPGKLSREVQARLGQQLRAMYEEVVSQGVPDRFAALLNQMNGDGNKDRQ
jgi:hypothetical protein